jgi:ABC-type bacteriocin/lantibiotic exporter with double-glycine peptidase domain
MERNKNLAFNRFLNLLRPDRQEIRNIYVFAIFSGILSLGLPLGIQMIINFIQLGQFSTSWFVLVGLVVLAIGLSGFLNIYQLKITENLQQRIFTRTAFEFAERIPKIKMVELVKRYAPELTNRFFDTLTIQKGLSKLLIDITAAALQIVFGLIVLSFYHTFFIFLGLCLVLLLIFIFRITARKGFSTSLEESTFKYKIAHWLEEIAHARISFKMASRSKLYVKTTNGYLHQYLSARDKHFKILVQQYIYLIGFKVLIALALLLLGGILVINQQMNIGQFVAAEIIILLVLSSVEKLILSIEVIYDVLTAVEKIGRVTDLPVEEYQGATLVENTNQGMHLSIVQAHFFSQELNQEVLSDFTLNIQPNEKVCVVSDSSVSTNVLFCLTIGLYEPHNGNITVDGIPLQNLNKSLLRDQMGSALYQDQLIHASISDNITMGRNFDLQQVAAICKRLNLLEFVESCPRKFDTILNPEGHFIPKDVVKRILLARAMVCNPRLMLFEDLTAGLSDAQSNEIAHRLKEIDMCTILITSHDPAIHKIADRIIEIEKGKIVFDASYELYANRKKSW